MYQKFIVICISENKKQEAKEVKTMVESEICGHKIKQNDHQFLLK